MKVECYDLEEEQWLVLTEKPGHVFGSAMCYLKGLMTAKTTDRVHLSYSTSKCDLQVLNVPHSFVGKLYTIGGVQSKQVDQYDVEADRWRAVFCSVTYLILVLLITGGRITSRPCATAGLRTALSPPGTRSMLPEDPLRLMQILAQVGIT